MIADALRRAYPSVLAKVLRHTGSLADAEDAVHDAIERALETWTDDTPESIEGWLVTVAVNTHRDRLRRARRAEQRVDALETLAARSPWARVATGEPDVLRGFEDDLLALLFACCHPALDDGESAALALATVVGLSTSEVAAAFVASPRTMEQRLTRARQRLRERGDVDGTTSERGRERLPAVLRTLYLLFNEGYWSTAGDAPIRADLCRLALGLARSLHATYPDESEVSGLLALFMLHEARRDARTDGDRAVPLPEQDRSRWDHDAIRDAAGLLERALARGAAGPFQIEAAISAVHCKAETAALTDWNEIAALYTLLEERRPTPAVRVNRAFAAARAEGPRAGLALLDGASDDPYAHLVRGTLLDELGQFDEAMRELATAEHGARNAEERRQIREKLDAVRRRRGP